MLSVQPLRRRSIQLLVCPRFRSKPDTIQCSRTRSRGRRSLITPRGRASSEILHHPHVATFIRRPNRKVAAIRRLQSTWWMAATVSPKRSETALKIHVHQLRPAFNTVRDEQTATVGRPRESLLFVQLSCRDQRRFLISQINDTDRIFGPDDCGEAGPIRRHIARPIVRSVSVKSYKLGP